MKHGLSAKKVVIGDEDPRDFEALRVALARDFQADTAPETELVDQLAGLFWRLRRVPAIEAAIVKARQTEAYSRVYSDVENDAWGRINNEARERCDNSFGDSFLRAIMNGTYNERLEQFRSQVVEQEETKGDFDASISKQTDERYQESRESELLLLIRDDDGMIEKLSRYQASLMNAASRVIRQLRLLKIMKGPTKLIAVE